MNRSFKSTAIVGILALAAGCVETSSDTSNQQPIGSANDLSSFEGARAGQAEMGVMNLGYEIVRQEGLTSYWFNRDTGACAAITTSGGRYSDVTMLPSADC